LKKEAKIDDLTKENQKITNRYHKSVDERDEKEGLLQKLTTDITEKQLKISRLEETLQKKKETEEYENKQKSETTSGWKSLQVEEKQVKIEELEDILKTKEEYIASQTETILTLQNEANTKDTRFIQLKEMLKEKESNLEVEQQKQLIVELQGKNENLERYMLQKSHTTKPKVAERIQQLEAQMKHLQDENINLTQNSNVAIIQVLQEKENAIQLEKKKFALLLKEESEASKQKISTLELQNCDLMSQIQYLPFLQNKVKELEEKLRGKGDFTDETGGVMAGRQSAFFNTYDTQTTSSWVSSLAKGSGILSSLLESEALGLDERPGTSQSNHTSSSSKTDSLVSEIEGQDSPTIDADSNDETTNKMCSSIGLGLHKFSTLCSSSINVNQTQGADASEAHPDITDDLLHISSEEVPLCNFQAELESIDGRPGEAPGPAPSTPSPLLHQHHLQTNDTFVKKEPVTKKSVVSPKKESLESITFQRIGSKLSLKDDEAQCNFGNEYMADMDGNDEDRNTNTTKGIKVDVPIDPFPLNIQKQVSEDGESMQNTNDIDNSKTRGLIKTADKKISKRSLKEWKKKEKRRKREEKKRRKEERKKKSKKAKKSKDKHITSDEETDSDTTPDTSVNDHMSRTTYRKGETRSPRSASAQSSSDEDVKYEEERRVTMLKNTTPTVGGLEVKQEEDCRVVRQRCSPGQLEPANKSTIDEVEAAYILKDLQKQPITENISLMSELTVRKAGNSGSLSKLIREKVKEKDEDRSKKNKQNIEPEKEKAKLQDTESNYETNVLKKHRSKSTEKLNDKRRQKTNSRSRSRERVRERRKTEGQSGSPLSNKMKSAHSITQEIDRIDRQIESIDLKTRARILKISKNLEPVSHEKSFRESYSRDKDKDHHRNDTRKKAPDISSGRARVVERALQELKCSVRARDAKKNSESKSRYKRKRLRTRSRSRTPPYSKKSPESRDKLRNREGENSRRSRHSLESSLGHKRSRSQEKKEPQSESKTCDYHKESVKELSSVQPQEREPKLSRMVECSDAGVEMYFDVHTKTRGVRLDGYGANGPPEVLVNMMSVHPSIKVHFRTACMTCGKDVARPSTENHFISGACSRKAESLSSGGLVFCSYCEVTGAHWVQACPLLVSFCFCCWVWGHSYLHHQVADQEYLHRLLRRFNEMREWHHVNLRSTLDSKTVPPNELTSTESKESLVTYGGSQEDVAGIGLGLVGSSTSPSCWLVRQNWSAIFQTLSTPTMRWLSNEDGLTLQRFPLNTENKFPNETLQHEENEEQENQDNAETGEEEEVVDDKISDWLDY